MKRYPEYKESGVEFIGEIPAHWEPKKLGQVSTIFKGGTPKRNVDKYFQGDLPWARPVDVTALQGALYIDDTEIHISEEALDNSGARRLPPGTVLLTSRATIGETVITTVPMATNQGFANFLCNEGLLNIYLVYYLQAIKDLLISLGSGTTFLEVTKGTLVGVKIPLPPLSEQTQIANFLDHKTGQIDELIRIKERRVELLQEKRAALINQTVTKGLDPNVEMKPSGVEWVSEIPAHWEMINTKYLFRLVTEPAPQNNDYELLSIYTDIGVRPRKELEERGNRATTTDGYWLVKKGDFIVNKLLAWMGAIGLSNYEGVTSPAYDILRKIPPLNEHFYEYLFRCGLYFTEFKKWSRGIMEVRLRLYFDQFGQIPLVFPPIDEQNKIVNFLDRKTGQIDDLISTEQQKIDLLKEYRQSLISEAVTGKIDVRNEV